MTFYLKYRPKNLDELDLPEVGQSLKKILKSNKIPHAFLFAGPKGTGKTSAARILAKVFNCENLSKDGNPCDKCEQCVSITKGSNLDVIEMDAASHRGIDDVRTLRDAVKLAPVKANKKIYIIDEAHMLTTEASNALLKTLEEPPEHVVFILATTNPEKLIDTIRSRVTTIFFRKASIDEIVKSLKRVVTSENIKIENDALSVIAQAADGAFRDAIKILEQLSAEEKELTKDILEEELFRNKAFDTDRFIGFLIKKDIKNLIMEIDKLGASGVTTEVFLKSLLGKLRTSLLTKVGVGIGEIKDLNKKETVYLIELFGDALSKTSYYPIEEIPLELAVIRWCGEGIAQKQPEEVHSGTVDTSDSKEDANLASDVPNTKIPASSPAVQNQAVSLSSSGEDIAMPVNDGAWRMILDQIKPLNASIEALLRASRPIDYDGKTLTLGVFYKFHKERLEDASHRKILESVIDKVFNSPTKVVCTLVEPPPKKIIEEAQVEPVLTEGKDQDIIKAAEEIFGN